MRIGLMAEPWWVNLLLLVPPLAYFLWRRGSGVVLTPQQLLTSGIFAAAFGFIEAVVVVYLRAAVGLLPGYQGTLADVIRRSGEFYQQSQAVTQFPQSLLTLEVLREAATILMLLSVALLTAAKASSRAAVFLWTFAIWDMTYYAALWASVRSCVPHVPMGRPSHQRGAMPRKTHPWGVPPWTVDFRPAPCTLPDQVDFAIVGGGFTGLSTAAWLRRFAPGRSVLVLESASLGDGASGRTGGMALGGTAADKLPGLGDVLAGYKRILRAFRIDSRLTLPGVWEIARSAPAKRSPISWNDSGKLKVVRRVPGGTVDPGKVFAGLARAAENAGAWIVEHAEVRALDFSNPLRLR